jgi:hypothetical protein
MAPIRGIPNDEESGLRFEEALSNIFVDPDFSQLKDDSLMTEENWKSWKVNETFSFQIPNLLKVLPHLKQSYMTYGEGLDIAHFSTMVTDPKLNGRFN